MLDMNRDWSIPISVQEVLLAGWLQDEDMGCWDKDAVKAMASLLALRIFEDGIPEKQSHMLVAAQKYFEEEERAIIQEANRLDDIKTALKKREPIATSILLKQLGIEDSSLLDEDFESLSPEIIDVFERRGENEVEISFPLVKFAGLGRSAMGLGTAKTLLVRIFIDYTGEMPTAFCLHLDTDTPSTDIHTEHSPWVCLDDTKEPDVPYCSKTPSVFTWQLSRVLFRYLKTNTITLASLHSFITKSITELTYSCIMCGASHDASTVRLRRSIPCTLPSCQSIWLNPSQQDWDFNSPNQIQLAPSIPLSIRIPELRTDPFALDLLLTSIFCATKTAHAQLLPNCPITPIPIVSSILNNLPALSIIRDAVYPSTILRKYHLSAEHLLLYASTMFRGFLTSATDNAKIPGFPPGTHQFVLASAAPELEKSFAAQIELEPQRATRILFHGTSLDRLPSILAQGLKIHSGGALQRTGAAHGAGIYMAEEPATSFSYAPAAVSWKNSGLSNMRLLLGCEVVGAGASVGNGIHVIKDERRVMVRYVFLLGATARVPVARHVVPALESACRGLRSGFL